jgi:hypothetical protein
MNHRALAASGLFALSLLAGGAAAEASPLPPKSSFTVVTSFVSESLIIAADGVWAGCTSVEDLENTANDVGPRKVQFSGVKLVHCPAGDVTIRYDAVMNWRTEQGRTMGSWSVVSSENPAVHSGAGRLVGVSRGCEDCIVDTFDGRVS